jgi:hypothetical protein
LKIKMTAKKSIVYGGKRLQAGEQFETVGESDANLLKAIGHAERYVEPPKPVEPVRTRTGRYHTRMMTADDTETDRKPEE